MAMACCSRLPHKLVQCRFGSFFQYGNLQWFVGFVASKCSSSHALPLHLILRLFVQTFVPRDGRVSSVPHSHMNSLLHSIKEPGKRRSR